VVVAQFGIHERLIVEGNAGQTARRILAHQPLFRFGIACDLGYCVGVVAVLTALYVILRPVNRQLALLAAAGRLIYALMWVLMTLNLFDALRFVNGVDALRVLDAEPLQAWARLNLGARFDQYYVGLLFCGLASTVCSYLWYRSGYIPKALAVWGVVASLACGGLTPLWGFSIS